MSEQASSLSVALTAVLEHAAALDPQQSAALAQALLSRFNLDNAAAKQSLRLAAILINTAVTKYQRYEADEVEAAFNAILNGAFSDQPPFRPVPSPPEVVRTDHARPVNGPATHLSIADGTAGLRKYISAAKQKRPHGVLAAEEIRHVVLRLLPSQGHMDRHQLVEKSRDILDFPEPACTRIEEAIQRLQDLNQVRVDGACVWRMKP